MSAECSDCGNDLVYGMGDMNDMFCPVCKRNDLLIELRRIGDRLQSESSRLVEWMALSDVKMPYEVYCASSEVRSALDEWTEVRRREAK